MLIEALLRHTRVLAFAGAVALSGLLMTGCCCDSSSGSETRAAEALAPEATPTPGH